jgi:predicted regulator of Ras-like GTPase activity (Roadblock/LC7/MglB family)
MPGKDGFDLLMWLREHLPQVKVVMITAYGSPSVRALAKQRGAVMYLEKPLDLEQLMQLVRQIVERKGFSVALKDMELADVLQFLSFANKTARVQVFNALGEGGEIALDGDNILWIRTPTNTGEEAFYEIMGWQGGSFEVLSLEKEQKRVEHLHVPLSFLLLEEARRRDEAVVSRGKEEVEIISRQAEAVRIDIAKELAAWREEVAGFVESALINKDGTSIAGVSNLPSEDLSIPAAYCAKAVKAIVDNLNATRKGDWQEVLITTDTHHIILHKLTDTVFFALTIIKDQGNLGMGRLQMEQFCKRVINELI